MLRLLEIHKTDEEMTKAQFELNNILEKSNSVLKEKMIENITHSYFNAMMEIDRKRLVERAQLTRLRIDYFLKSMFFFIFYKLHRGDKLKAFELLDEIKKQIIKI